MYGKVMLLGAFGAGYVLGARAGRQRYEQIASQAQRFWNDPRVRAKAGQAQDLAKDTLDQAGSKLAQTDLGQKASDLVGSKDTGKAGSPNSSG